MSAHGIVGVSESLLTDSWDWPVHGLRHPPRNGTSGWYLWTGDYADADDFFEPLHAAHLGERCPEVLQYLDLAPGSRFLIAPDYEDIWTDDSLLDI
ncbi:immunity protein Imm33 domain-containing protein [Mumia quercus]|uniref:immunity protein Imm33 domain-containing protein n=1 Tax=Mumia quercus TaxID=2976125 RepID=UPI0021CF61BB|nr:hypothetical protein [Mumia quercus]